MNWRLLVTFMSPFRRRRVFGETDFRLPGNGAKDATGGGMRAFQIRHLALCLALAAIGCGDHVAVRATDGKLSAACNWNGECLPDFRFFTYEGPEVKLRLIFGPGLDTADSLKLIRANLHTIDVEISSALVPTHEHMVCGQTAPMPFLLGYQGGILGGRVHGGIRLCRVIEGDILDDSGIDPVSFTVDFDLAFDPREKPTPAPRP